MLDEEEDNRNMGNVNNNINIAPISQQTSVSSISSSSNSNNDRTIQYYVEEYKIWSNKQQNRIVDDLLPYVNHPLPVCCNKNCSMNFTARDVQKYRYDTLCEGNERKRMMIGFAIEEKKRNIEKKFILCGRNVCTKFAKFARGVSNHSFYQSYRKNTSNNETMIDDELNSSEEEIDLIPRHKKLEFKKTIIIKYFTDLIEWNEKMPDVNEVHLPHGSKKELYYNFLSDTRTLHNDFECAYSYFMQIWKLLFSHVKLRKHSRFTLCDECVKFKEKINSTLGTSEKNILREEYYKHKSYIKKEKYAYYTKRYMSTTYPDKYVSLILDGSDMANYGLPFFYLKTKETTKGYKMQIKLIGVIVHGIGAYAFLVHKHWTSDPNLTIEVLHRIWKLIPEPHNRKLFVQVYLLI